VERWGDGALWFSAGLGLSACVALVIMTTSIRTTPHGVETH
jgi:hypothetical protein